jgi:enediyne biosynthesis protein E3
MKSTMAGNARRRLFTPDDREVTFARRGFHVSETAQQANLEGIGSTFLVGYGYGMAGSSVQDIEAALETVERPARGFAYEGCAMALAVRDGLRLAGQHWVRDFLAGPAQPHIYMSYIGVGWAMARLPKMRWRAVMPQDTLLRWLALDGYGFHQAYFRTKQYVDGQYQTAVPLFRPADYANRAVDQGIGRALWFVNGSDVERVTAAIRSFAPERRGDLWSGAGLASVYAGGADEADLKLMTELAGEHLPHAAQGAAFAVKARLLADLVTPHTEIGARVYCHRSVGEAAAVCDQAREGLPDADGPVPGFEVWRERIRNRLAG